LTSFLDGINGGNISVSQAIITDITKPEERARTFGLFGASLGVGFMVEPLISYFTTQISLGSPFIVSSILAAIALVLTIWLLPETIKIPAPKTSNIFDLGLKNVIQGLSMPGVGALQANPLLGYRVYTSLDEAKTLEIPLEKGDFEL
jgi:MFS family permease